MQTSLLDSLAHPQAGLFRSPTSVFPGADAPQIAISTVSCDLRHLKMPRGVHCANEIRAGAAALTHEEAQIRAMAEAIERYATSVYCDDQFVVATAEELAGECLDLDSLPLCSTVELRDRHCPLIRPNKHESIRWVKAIALAENATRFVPAIMVYSHLANVMPGERFWFPISTGCAAHFALESAIIGGLCEVIERDAISLTWLRELELPRIVFDCEAKELAPYWNLYRRSSSAVEFEFYDATTDIGVPTVYGLRISTQSDVARTLVGCCTATSVIEAIKKVFCDLVSLSTQFLVKPQYPDSFSEFRNIMHGASYMADARRESAFDFLRKNEKRIGLSSLLAIQEIPNDLEKMVEHLRIRGMTPYVVDLSTDEAHAVGMKIVRVLIPQLQPISFCYLARYLGHSRLYSANLPGGQMTRRENELNVLPQPFA